MVALNLQINQKSNKNQAIEIAFIEKCKEWGS